MLDTLLSRLQLAWWRRRQADFLLSRGIAVGIKPQVDIPAQSFAQSPGPVTSLSEASAAESDGEAMVSENATAEPVRLVVWDLDETFWHGTLTEGGMTYRREVHDIVVTLAQRGIVSSICSKNDIASVREILQKEGIWDYFVFPSVSWDAKGPRLASLVEATQLRAPTILFIDDNPMNLAEARHYVPGIQLSDETIIPDLLANPLLKGKTMPR